MILYSGSSPAFAEHEGMLGCLGRTEYLGSDPAEPLLCDAGLIAFLYGTLAGLLHGSALAAAEEIDLEAFQDLARQFFSSFISEAVEETSDRVVARNYDDSQSELNTHLGGIDLLVVRASQDAGINVDVMTAIRDSFAHAIAAGRGDQDIAAMFEVARETPTRRLHPRSI